jgi:KAP family P-loop domain
LQAINLLLSADQSNLFFILGLDREMVAAVIAAKNEKILPYLTAGRTITAPKKLDFHRIGVDYAYNFMEKFVQVPFRVPSPDEREIASWVSGLTRYDENEEAPGLPSQQNLLQISSGADPDRFEDVAKKLVQLFGFNPRRVKQFVNVFRLRLMIALSTGILIPAQASSAEQSSVDGITIQQLGLFTAILMDDRRWSVT